MCGGSGCAIITGATATGTAAWCGVPVTGTTAIITTTVIGIIITGTTIITVGIATDAAAPLCNDCGAMVGSAAGLPDGRPADPSLGVATLRV